MHMLLGLASSSKVWGTGAMGGRGGIRPSHLWVPPLKGIPYSRASNRFRHTCLHPYQTCTSRHPKEDSSCHPAEGKGDKEPAREEKQANSHTADH